MPANRRYIHPAHKELLVTMSATMSSKQIARPTKISQRTVQRVLQLWKESGVVERQNYDKRHL
ncbi:hypothetical protein BJ138DRAFT_1160468 [Hygrophoropsis aurantiaca]|uniref:Uncharacterized protein n=1 Tax=Hygrophoropsis aurantiaca TaxID=72124 RepID=A0ACB8A1Y3_9AGAM|nr:hypothetical protein BJ138DRAFT_1160468 [Hygrophoropsis aurantiaca]